MTEILAFVGFISFLATAITVIYGWYNWRTNWEQRYDRKELEMKKDFSESFKELTNRVEKLENKNLI